MGKDAYNQNTLNYLNYKNQKELKRILMLTNASFKDFFVIGDMEH